MNRYLIVGPSGSGKSTLARAISERCGLPWVELDALFFNRDWTQRVTFEADVGARASARCWVMDGNHVPVRDLLWARANVVVWLDMPRWLTEYRVVGRSLSRWLRRTELHNGCREPAPIDFRHSVRGWFDQRHPVRSAWRKHSLYTREYEARFADPRWANKDLIRLRTGREVASFVAAQGGPEWWIRRSIGGGEWDDPAPAMTRDGE